MAIEKIISGRFWCRACGEHFSVIDELEEDLLCPDCGKPLVEVDEDEDAEDEDKK